MSKVLIFHHYGGWGGAGIMLYNLTEELVQAGHEVCIILPEGKLASFIQSDFPAIEIKYISSVQDFPHYYGGDYFALHPRFIARFFRSFCSQPEFETYIKDIAPTYLIANSSVLIPYLKKVRSLNPGIKTILVIQENVASGLLGVRKRYLRRLVEKYSDLTLFISEFDQRHFHINSKKGIMRNWISKKSLDANHQADDVGEVGMLYMGGLSRLKGLHVLLNAVRLLRRRGINEPLTILGDMQNNSKNPLERRLFTNLLRSTPGVQIRGNVKDPSSFIAASSVVIFPVTKPHQGRPIMEAGCHSKPVIATAFEALKEDLIHKHNGLMFSNGNSIELADLIEQILSDQDVLKRMGIANRHMFESLHNSTNANVLLEYILHGVHK